jgi:hypothetical protein
VDFRRVYTADPRRRVAAGLAGPLSRTRSDRCRGRCPAAVRGRLSRLDDQLSICRRRQSILSGSDRLRRGGLLVNPFYLNYGLVREPLLATRAANSLLIQITKLATYASFGVMTLNSIENGVVAGAGALAAIWLSLRWLPLVSNDRFRRFTVFVMLGSGVYMMWQHRTALALLMMGS